MLTPATSMSSLIAKLRTFGLVSGVMLVLAGVACTCALVLAVVTAANSLSNQNNSNTFDSCLQTLSNQLFLSPNSSCDDGNQCTEDFAVGTTESCTSLPVEDGTPCTNICFADVVPTCDRASGQCLGTTCRGFLPNSSGDGCNGIMPGYTDTIQGLAEEPDLTGIYAFPPFNYVEGLCEQMIVDIGFPGIEAHSTMTQLFYFLPIFLGWPSPSMPDVCMYLLNASDPFYGCVTSRFYFVPPVPNVNFTITDVVLEGLYPPNNVFICRYSYNCGPYASV
jgi:hypothetical protein